MIVGIDEVGRGCWAGPLVASAVVLNHPIDGLTDSKKLSKRKREQLAKVIYQQAATVGTGWVSATEVDIFGLTAAVHLGMQRAMQKIEIAYDEVVIDGSYNFLRELDCSKAVIKADATVPAVSAASIIAKVARDNWMCTYGAGEYPLYGFEKHVGYGTRYHMEMLHLHGICDLHRKSFKPIKRFITTCD